MSERDMSGATSTSPPVASPQTEQYRFCLSWTSRGGAGGRVVMLHYDSTLNQTTVLTLHRSRRLFLGVQAQERSGRTPWMTVLQALHENTDNAVRWRGESDVKQTGLQTRHRAPLSLSLSLSVNWQPLARDSSSVRMSNSTMFWHPLLSSAERKRQNSSEGFCKHKIHSPFVF